MLSFINTMATTGMLFAAPLIIAGIGGLFSERSGVVNICLEAGMLVGAFASATSLYFFYQAGLNTSYAWLSFLIAGVAGMVFMALLAVSAIHCRADQTISGTAINILSTGLCVYICSIIFGGKRSLPFAANYNFTKVSIPLLSKIPLIGDFFFANKYPTIYVAYVVAIVSWFVLYKTSFGLRLRSCGEFPQASASVGISVIKMRWIAVLISGFLSGLGGAAILIPSTTEFTAQIISGLGFVAVATCIFGGYKPFGVMWSGILFGFVKGVADIYYNAFPLAQSIPNFDLLAKCVPYIITIVVVTIFAGKNRAPKADGQIYDPSRR